MTEAQDFPQCPTAEEFAAFRRAASGSRRTPRCYGMSSDALAAFALGTGTAPTTPGAPNTPGGSSWSGEECGHNHPHDEDDLAACERTYLLAPDDLRERMLPVLEAFRNWVHHGINRHGVQLVDRPAERSPWRRREASLVDRLVVRGTLASSHRVTVQSGEADEGEADGEFLCPTVTGVTVDRFSTVDVDPFRETKAGPLVTTVSMETPVEVSLREWLDDGRWDAYLDADKLDQVLDRVLEDLHVCLVERTDAFLTLPAGWEEGYPASIELELRPVTGVPARFVEMLRGRRENRPVVIVQCKGQLAFDEAVPV